MRGEDLGAWETQRIAARRKRDFGEVPRHMLEIKTKNGFNKKVGTDAMADAVRDAVREKPLTQTDLITALRQKGLVVSETGLASAIAKLVADNHLSVRSSKQRRGKGSGKRYALKGVA